MKVQNYGEMLAIVKNKPLLKYKTFGSYQGDYIAVLGGEESVEIYKGSYGSCSGCDWLEGEKDWESNEVSDEKASDYCKDDKPFLILPKEVIKELTASKLETLFPANTRNSYDDWNFEDILNLLK